MCGGSHHQHTVPWLWIVFVTDIPFLFLYSFFFNVIVWLCFLFEVGDCDVSPQTEASKIKCLNFCFFIFCLIASDSVEISTELGCLEDFKILTSIFPCASRETHEFHPKKTKTPRRPVRTQQADVKSGLSHVIAGKWKGKTLDFLNKDGSTKTTKKVNGKLEATAIRCEPSVLRSVNQMWCNSTAQKQCKQNKFFFCCFASHFPAVYIREEKSSSMWLKALWALCLKCINCLKELWCCHPPS